MQINLNTILDYGHIIVVLLVSIMALKAIIIFAILYPVLQRRTSLKTALALFQVGEFSLAILALAHNNDLLSSTYNQVLIITIVISMIITPFVLKNITKIADRFSPEPEIEYETIASSGYKNHIIICGYGPLGQKIAKHFKKLGISYIILEHSVKLVDLGLERNEPIIMANVTRADTLEAVGIRESVAVIIAIDNAFKLRLTCDAISSIDADINTVVKVKNSSHQKIIDGFKINHVINESEEIANILIKEVLNCKIKNT